VEKSSLGCFTDTKGISSILIVYSRNIKNQVFLFGDILFYVFNYITVQLSDSEYLFKLCHTTFFSVIEDIVHDLYS